MMPSQNGLLIYYTLHTYLPTFHPLVDLLFTVYRFQLQG